MPLYEYICLNCELQFETLVLSSREEVVCPVCHSRRLERLMSPFASGSSGPGKIGQGLSGSGSGGCSPRGGFS